MAGQIPGIGYTEYGGNPSTGAPGGGSISETHPGPAGTGAPNSPATGQASPQDVVREPQDAAHDFSSNASGLADQAGYGRFGGDVSGPDFVHQTTTTDTGASGSVSISHNHYGRS